MGKKRRFKRPQHEKQEKQEKDLKLPSSQISVPVQFKKTAGNNDSAIESLSRSVDAKGQGEAGQPAGGEPTRNEISESQAGESGAGGDGDAAQEGGSTDSTTHDGSHFTGASKRKRKSVADILAEQASDFEREVARRQLLASAWRVRDRLYQQLFGKPAYVTPSNYGPPSEEVPADFKEKADSISLDTADQGDPSLEEQHLAVLAYGPDPLAPYWKYVTAGLASPWMQYEQQTVSGFGLELMVKSPVDAPWAGQFLRTLAFYVFNHAGTLPPGARVGLNGSIDPGFNSELRNAFIWYADEAPDALYELPSGAFGIFMAVGMTDDERSFAESIEEYGTWSIQAVLRQAGLGQVTDPSRSSVMKRPDIDKILSSVGNFLETFKANRSGQFNFEA